MIHLLLVSLALASEPVALDTEAVTLPVASEHRVSVLWWSSAMRATPKKLDPAIRRHVKSGPRWTRFTTRPGRAGRAPEPDRARAPRNETELLRLIPGAVPGDRGPARISGGTPTVVLDGAVISW